VLADAVRVGVFLKSDRKVRAWLTEAYDFATD
jgi:hypothetical protein